MITKADYLQAGILEYLKSTRGTATIDEIGEACEIVYTPLVSPLLGRLQRMGLILSSVAQNKTRITLSKEAEQLLDEHTPEETLQIATSSPFIGLLVENHEIPWQQWFDLFEYARLPLCPKKVAFEQLAEHNEARRFLGQFMMQPDTAKEKDSIIFQVDEVAKALSTFVQYVIEAAKADRVDIESIPFLQPLHLATLGGDFPFLGVAFTADGAIRGETEWRFFAPGVVSHHSPEAVMKHFAIYLEKSTYRRSWYCFVLPWDVGLALRNSPFLSDFYELRREECSAAIQSVLHVEHLILRKEAAERMLVSVIPGKTHWKEYQDVCLSILHGLFCPPLGPVRDQSSTADGLEIRDAIFSNAATSGSWQRLREKVPHKFVLFEFKNWSKQLDKAAVVQVRQYLGRKSIGKLGIIICRNGPSISACKAQYVAYRDSDAVILVLGDMHLLEMVTRKEMGYDPASLIEELVDEFLAAF